MSSAHKAFSSSADTAWGAPTVRQSHKPSVFPQMVEAQQLFSREEEAEVKVLALSPRCWTISSFCYLEDPARFFPESLSQHLSKFADFYTQSECQAVLKPSPASLRLSFGGQVDPTFTQDSELGNRNHQTFYKEMIQTFTGSCES